MQHSRYLHRKRLADILFGMSAEIKPQAEINPYAAPLSVSNTVVPMIQSRDGLPYRGSPEEIRQVDFLATAADLSYVALCCCLLTSLWFTFGDAHAYALIAFQVTCVLWWFTVVAALFKALGLCFETIVAALILPIPIIGTVAFLKAKGKIRTFMISNGYRPQLLGFAVDDAERQSMAQELRYEPSEIYNHDGSKREYIYTLGECWIWMGIGILILGSPVWFFVVALSFN